MYEHMQRSPGTEGQLSRDIVREAPRRGGKWIWSRIKGLNQQLCKGLGPKEELEEKIGKLESIILLRYVFASRAKPIRSRIVELERKLSELEYELDELRVQFPLEEAKAKAWRSISLYGQNFKGQQATDGWFNQENPAPNHWEGQDLPPELAFKYVKKVNALLRIEHAQIEANMELERAEAKKKGKGGDEHV